MISTGETCLDLMRSRSSDAGRYARFWSIMVVVVELGWARLVMILRMGVV